MRPHRLPLPQQLLSSLVTVVKHLNLMELEAAQDLEQQDIKRLSFR
jgi:hypothetical protein